MLHEICCNLPCWINEKHEHVWSCAILPYATQLIRFVKYNSWNMHFSCFIVCAVPLKFIDMLHHTNASYFMQHISSNLFRRCVLCLKEQTGVEYGLFSWNSNLKQTFNKTRLLRRRPSLVTATIIFLVTA